MRLTFLPKTNLGKLALCLLLFFFLMFLLLHLAVLLGGEGGQGFFGNLFLAIPGILAMMAVVAAFFISLISVIKKKERAILIFITIFIGGVALLFLVGEFLLPH